METMPNKILLRLDRKYAEEIITEGGLKLYLDPSYRPEWNATVTGTVVANSKGSKIPTGTKVYFSYMVVNKRDFGSNADYFASVKEGNEYDREYTNQDGLTIRVKARPGIVSLKWHGVLIDKNFDYIDGVQGTQSDVERWLSQFKFGGNDQMVYKNLVEVNGKDYWVADESQVFAYLDGKKIKPLNDFVLMKSIEFDITQLLALQQKNSGIIPNTKLRMEGMAKIEISGDKKYRKGEIVFFNNAYVQQYEFDGQHYLVLNKKRIVATNAN